MSAVPLTAGSVAGNAASAVAAPDLGAVQFEELDSACPTAAVAAAKRIDPFWHGLWVGGSQASWLSRQVAERRAAAGFGTVPARERRWDPDAAVRAITGGRQRARRLTALAAMAMWRTLTRQQIAAICGQTSDTQRWDDTSIMWAAGLIERGKVVTEGAASQIPKLYRVLPGRAMDRVLDELSYAEWVAVTGGQRVTVGPQHDRHNILAAELGLRAAELCPVGTVLGEALCGRHHFAAPTMHPGRAAKRGIDAGDLAVVRPDGLRIVVEVTAHANRHWRRKVDQWIDIMMGYRAGDDPGLVVLFVEAANPDRPDPNDVFRVMRRAVEAAVTERAGAASRKIAERIGVARWRWWFPGPGAVTTGFPGLECSRPTGPRDARWEPAELLDPTAVPFAPPDPERFHAVLDASRHLLGVPHWLRDTGTVDWAPVLNRRAGVPVPEPFRPPRGFRRTRNTRGPDAPTT